MPAAIASPATIRIAIVQDDPQFQAAVASAIRQTEDMRLLWVAGTLARGLLALEVSHHHTVLTVVGRTCARRKVRSKAEAICEARVRGLI